MPSVASGFLCVFEEDEDWALDIEDMLERCASTVIASIALIELLDTKLGKTCQ